MNNYHNKVLAFWLLLQQLLEIFLTSIVWWKLDDSSSNLDSKVSTFISRLWIVASWCLMTSSWSFLDFPSFLFLYSLGIVGASSTNMEPEIKIEIVKSFEKSVRSVMIQTRDSVIQTQYLLHTEEQHLEFNLF